MQLMHTDFSVTLEFISWIIVIIFFSGSGWFLLRKSEKDIKDLREDIQHVKTEMQELKISLAVQNEKITHVSDQMFSFNHQICKVLKLLSQKNAV